MYELNDPVSASGGTQPIPINTFRLGNTSAFGIRCRSQNSAGSSNWISNAVSLHMLQPFVSIGYEPSIVRAGDSTRVEWGMGVDTSSGISGPTVTVAPQIINDYDMNCNIAGAVNDQFTVPPDDSGSVTSGPLTNAFDTRLQCVVTTNDVQGDAIEDIQRIEVIPTPREN